MFCYQCEQTAKGTGCTTNGVCGKSGDTAVLQDLLLHTLKGISTYAYEAAKLGARDEEIDVFTLEGLFSTVTNVNFDNQRLISILEKSTSIRDKAKALYEKASADAGKEAVIPSWPATCEPGASVEALVKQGEQIGIEARKEKLGDDITGLQELLTYGLKGVAAYADHAHILGKNNPEIFTFIHEALAYLFSNKADLNELLGLCLKCGEINLKAMEILDAANTEAYGHPEPTQVRVTPIKGKAILVSGHDLKMLDELLKQTEGKGINVYTHGEMLPTLAYPGLKKYSHLAGNYGGAWQDQKKEFEAFPGAILMTTNCIQKPRDTYNSRIFTTGLVAFPGVNHIPDYNYTPVIETALNAEGFTEDAPEQKITIGFGRNAVMSVAGQVIDAVKAGSIKHFFLIGGCDGAKSGRNYYTDLAKSVPDDCVILTLACGKYRFNKLEFGDIGGIPRLLDVGQCNDAYSAIQIAAALADAFDCGVNELPLSMILSWYEQKAVAILLTLLHLGITGIRLGPTLPAFITPAALDILVEKFQIAPTTTVEEDLKAILA